MTIELFAVIVTIGLVASTFTWGAVMHVFVSRKHKKRQERERELERTTIHRVRI